MLAMFFFNVSIIYVGRYARNLPKEASKPTTRSLIMRKSFINSLISKISTRKNFNISLQVADRCSLSDRCSFSLKSNACKTKA